MVSKISVIIPAYYEEKAILMRCIASVMVAAKNCPCLVETCLALNIKGVGNARNQGAEHSSGDVLVFLDVDCTMSPGYLKEVYEKASDIKNIGGGTKWVKMDKYSLGRLLFHIPAAIVLYWYGVTIGAIWIKREYFDMLGGFSLGKYEDLDFAIRLRRLAKDLHRTFRSIKNNHIIWSTRTFDKYGQWFWLKRYHIFKEKHNDQVEETKEG